jgi:hypothetical protein
VSLLSSDTCPPYNLSTKRVAHFATHTTPARAPFGRTCTELTYVRSRLHEHVCHLTPTPSRAHTDPVCSWIESKLPEHVRRKCYFFNSFFYKVGGQEIGNPTLIFIRSSYISR